MDNKVLVPHNEFYSLSIPFSTKEQFELEENIKKNGVLEPILTWRGFIVDGYKRMLIIEDHNLLFKTLELDYETKEEVIQKRVEMEYSKKNLSILLNNYIIGSIYIASLKKRGKKKGKKGSYDPVKQSKQKKSAEDSRTNKFIADTFKVAPRTVDRAKKYVDALNALTEIHGYDFKMKVLNRELKQFDMEKIKDLAARDKTVQKDIINLLMKDEKKSFLAAKKEALLDYFDAQIDLNVKFDTNILYNGSAPEVLSQFEDNCIDCVFTDFPWGVDFKADVGKYIRYEDDFKTSMPLLDATCKELARVAKPHAHLYFVFAITLYSEVLEILTKYFTGVEKIPIIWQKTTKPWRDSSRQYGNTYEAIFFVNRGDKPLRETSDDVLKFESDKFKEKIHENQKPIRLMQHFIERSSAKNEIVLDCFAGSGSTCRAARLLDRRYIGIEKDSKIYEKALEYINQD